MSEIQERDSFTIGESATITRTITYDDINAFAEVSGDYSPIHIDAEYAQGTFFGGRIAHGALVAGVISAVLGTKLPGPGAIYMSQQMRFVAPVRPGDTITARAEVSDWDDAKGRVTLLTEVTNQDNIKVLTGEARLVMQSFLREKS
jgi:3-hydroxybutyryl-CoA dehydratase